MNSKTSHPFNADHVKGEQVSIKPLISWLASAHSAVTQFGQVGRGFMMLFILLMFAIPSLAMLLPRNVTSVHAPLDIFWAERALTPLPTIASEPHPQGSAALTRVQDYLVRQLTDMGLEVQVQRAAKLENVVARLRGTHMNDAIRFVSIT